MKKSVLLAITIATTIILMSFVSAQDEILLQVNIFNDGSASIVGSSTTDPLIEDIDYEAENLYGITQHLTSKQGERWTFSLNLKDAFSSMYIKIILPEEAKLGIVDSSIEPIISVEGKSVVLEFIDQNNIPEIKFYYELQPKQGSDSSIYFLIIAMAVSMIIIIIWLASRKRKKKTIDIKKKVKRSGFEEKLRLVRPTLNERENKIINVLLKHKKIRQAELQRLTNIPKVSLSRHLANLENKNLIIKKAIGKTNIIQINRNFDKNHK